MLRLLFDWEKSLIRVTPTRWWTTRWRRTGWPRKMLKIKARNDSKVLVIKEPKAWPGGASSFWQLAILSTHWKIVFTRDRSVNQRMGAISCKIFEHFALQAESVIEFVQLGSTSFIDGTTLAPKLANPPSCWKSNSIPSKTRSGLPDPDQLIFCTI
jgi:hypothetical protein